MTVPIDVVCCGLLEASQRLPRLTTYVMCVIIDSHLFVRLFTHTHTHTQANRTVVSLTTLLGTLTEIRSESLHTRVFVGPGDIAVFTEVHQRVHQFS
jgi:hypothetical protein